jgi:hypothetical protein
MTAVLICSCRLRQNFVAVVVVVGIVVVLYERGVGAHDDRAASCCTLIRTEGFFLLDK